MTTQQNHFNEVFSTVHRKKNSFGKVNVKSSKARITTCHLKKKKDDDLFFDGLGKYLFAYLDTLK